jgi:hypothetical protein
MATPPEDAVAAGPFGAMNPPHLFRRRQLPTAVFAQFEARPERPPPLKLMTIGGSSQDSIALK